MITHDKMQKISFIADQLNENFTSSSEILFLLLIIQTS